MENYQKIQAKATIYLQTEVVKKIRRSKSANSAVRYEVGGFLGLWNLIALILYTDYSAHCSEFSASFRKLSAFETLSVTKERNRNFWWMAKTLRETVEIFGKSREDGYLNKKKGMYGPFYTGVNRKMVISQFNIRLCAPTSTTKQLSVALRFGGGDGTIIQLNNTGRHREIDNLRGFDVSWLSKFKEEDERLFIGGFYMMRVQSIRLTQTRQNFQNLISPLYYLDNMISGKPGMGTLNTNEKDRKVIEHLFKYKMTQQKDEKMDKYIYECFDAFVKNKKSLNIHLHNLSFAKDFMSGMIVHSIRRIYQFNHDLEDDTDGPNLMRSELSTVFSHVTNVYINSDAFAGNYSFSLLGLLSVLKASKWKKVTIEGEWISDVCKSSRMASIIEEYEISKFKMEIKDCEWYESQSLPFKDYIGKSLSISKVGSE